MGRRANLLWVSPIFAFSVAADDRHHDLVQVRQAGDDPGVEVLVLSLRAEHGHIVAGAEGLPRAAEHDDVDVLPPLQVLQLPLERPEEDAVERVELLRPVQGEVADAAAVLPQDGLFIHIEFLLSIVPQTILPGAVYHPAAGARNTM